MLLRPSHCSCPKVFRWDGLSNDQERPILIHFKSLFCNCFEQPDNPCVRQFSFDQILTPLRFFALDKSIGSFGKLTGVEGNLGQILNLLQNKTGTAYRVQEN